MAVPLPDLPGEVVATIVHHVNRLPFHRIDTLKSCSLVSSAFARPSQSRIFSKINFDISRTSRFAIFQSLCGTLLKNRKLGTYIRELQVRSDSSDPYEVHIPAFNAFRTLIAVQKFTFICGRRGAEDHTGGPGADGGQYGGVGWEHFARSVQANLEFIFALPCLRTLELGGIQNFPSSLLHSFMRLDYLLLDSDFTIDNNLTAGSMTLNVLSNIRLKSLTLREVNESLVSGLASVLAYKPESLKRLDLAAVRFAGVERFSGAVWALMRLGCRALEEFEWEGVAARPHAFRPIDLAVVKTTLRHLTVSITYRLWFDEPQVLTDLHALLRQLSATDSALEVVTIKTSFAGNPSGNTGREGATFSMFDVTRDPEFLDEWSALDKILSHKKAFKKLDRIELEYVPSMPTASHRSTHPVLPARSVSWSTKTRSLGAPPSLSELAYAKELEWWTETACAFAEQLAGTRSKGVVIAFGESKTQRRSWSVFEPRSPLSPAVENVNGASRFPWQPLNLKKNQVPF